MAVIGLRIDPFPQMNLHSACIHPLKCASAESFLDNSTVDRSTSSSNPVLFLFGNDLIRNLVICGLRDHFLFDKLVFSFVWTILYNFLRIGIADMRK